MSTGRWMTIETACKRAASIEGVAQSAFLKLARSLKSGEITGRVTKKNISGFSIEEFDKYDIQEFIVDYNFWCHVQPNITAAGIELDQWVSKIDEPGPDEEFLLKTGELFVMAEWQFSVLTETFEKVFSGRLSPPLESLVAGRKPNSGGRPPIYDWAAAGGFIAAYVDVEGYPPTQSALVDVVIEWFKKNDREPHRREVERFVRQMYQTHEDLLKVSRRVGR